MAAGRRRLTACFAAGALAATCAAFAHHSFAMFDQTKQVSLQGTVREFQWTNPHAFIQLDVPNAAGGSDVWSVELNSPNNLKRQGWRSSLLKPGDKVTVVINPLREDKRGGLFVSVTLADGTVVMDPFHKRGGPVNVPTAQ
jgi:hypothetical protein